MHLDIHKNEEFRLISGGAFSVTKKNKNSEDSSGKKMENPKISKTLEPTSSAHKHVKS